MRKKVVSPAHRRAAAQQVVAAGMCSQRAACRHSAIGPVHLRLSWATSDPGGGAVKETAA